MRQIAAVLLCLMLGTSFAQSKNDLEAVKKRALETVRIVIKTARPDDSISSLQKARNCTPEADQLYTGKPLLVRALVHPTEKDFKQLRQRVKKAQNENSDFFVATESNFLENYRDKYQSAVFDRKCGYLFHAQTRLYRKRDTDVGRFQPLPARKAQKRLHSKSLPAFVWFYTSLSPQREGYLWVAGSKAVEAFGQYKAYQIVDRSGKPVAPLETRLETQIFREPFVTSMGDPSAWWRFGLAVRLEPLKTP